jgi:hypothetical protein
MRDRLWSLRQKLIAFWATRLGPNTPVRMNPRCFSPGARMGDSEGTYQ